MLSSSSSSSSSYAPSCKKSNVTKRLQFDTRCSKDKQILQCKTELYKNMLLVADAGTKLHSLKNYEAFCLYSFIDTLPIKNEQVKVLVQRFNASLKVREWARLYNSLVSQGI